MTNRVVIAGAGQAVSHWSGEGPSPSPLSLQVEAATHAISRLQTVDVLAVVRTTEDSVPTSTYPFGRNLNPPGTLARELKLRTEELIYHHVGGQSPQELVNEMANRISRGEVESALIVGAEAVGAFKRAQKSGVALDWADENPSDFEDRGAALDWLHPDELRHGLMTAAGFYGIMENAQANAAGHTKAQHCQKMAELFAPFSQVAATNPYSQFPTARSTEFLTTPSPQNFPTSAPYLKWLMAQDGVNQGAAVLLMSENKAKAEGLSDLTYLRAGGEASDVLLSRRLVLSRSQAMDAAITAAVGASEWDLNTVDKFDLYSCFPVAVESALMALEYIPKGALTVTGGLPYFGGPGNNYSLHAIAEMHARLSGTEMRGFVIANGGWMSKESVGLYSGKPCEFVPVEPANTIHDEVEICRENCAGIIESYTISYGRSGPQFGTVFVRLRDGRRALATVQGEALAKLDKESTPISCPVQVAVRNGVGHLAFD